MGDDGGVSPVLHSLELLLYRFNSYTENVRAVESSVVCDCGTLETELSAARSTVPPAIGEEQYMMYRKLVP